MTEKEKEEFLRNLKEAEEHIAKADAVALQENRGTRVLYLVQVNGTTLPADYIIEHGLPEALSFLSDKILKYGGGGSIEIMVGLTVKRKFILQCDIVDYECPLPVVDKDAE